MVKGRNIKNIFIPVRSIKYIFSGQNMEASILDRHNYLAYLLFLMAEFDKDFKGVR